MLKDVHCDPVLWTNYSWFVVYWSKSSNSVPAWPPPCPSRRTHRSEPQSVSASGSLNSSLTIYQRTWFNDILYFISFLSSSFPHLPVTMFPVEDKLGGKTENSLTFGQKVSCPRLDKLSNPNQSSGRWRPITLILFLMKCSTQLYYRRYISE